MWGACWIRWEECRQCIGWGSTHSAWTISPKQQHLFINCLHKTVSWHCQRGRWRWCWGWRWPPPPSGGCRPHRDRFPSGYLSFFEVKNIKLNLDKLKDNCVTFWNKIRKIMGKSFFLCTDDSDIITQTLGGTKCFSVLIVKSSPSVFAKLFFGWCRIHFCYMFHVAINCEVQDIELCVSLRLKKSTQ